MSADDLKTVTYDDFGNGIDRRVGLVTRAANKFFELENYVITTGRKIRRRPPMRNIGGLLDPSTQFCRYLNGKITTVAPYGTTVTHTIVGYTVETLFFDMPEKALPTWELLDFALFNDTLVAVIRHSFDSVHAPQRVFTHVWDEVRPTYVADPACPTSWSSEFPLHAYGEGKIGAYVNFIPRLAISADRVYLSRPDGNVAFSGAGSPRIWNTRTPDEILTDGRWWYWISTNDPGDQTMVLPVSYRDLKLDQRYAAYVLEYCGSDGRWVQLREQNLISAYEDYRVESLPNRYVSTDPAEIRLIYRLPGDGLVIRFRALPKPPAILQTGLYVNPDARVVGGVMSHAGNGQIIPTFTLPTPLDVGEDYIVSVAAEGAPIPVPVVAIGAPGSMPFNGQERYWMRILANAIADDTGNKLLYALTSVLKGTFHTSASVTVTGTAGTKFLTDLAPGRILSINGVRRVVDVITSDILLTVTVAYLGVFAGPADNSISITSGGTRVTGIGTLFMSELEVGRQVEINGERRIVLFIGSDEDFEVTAPFSTAYTGLGLRDPRYRYAYEVGDTGNEWYAGVEADITFKEAGRDDAGYLGTAIYDSTGELPLCIATLQNRILVQFKATLQAWAVGPSVTDMHLLSVDGQSSGKNTAPQAALIDGLSALPTANGVRLFQPTGNNKDYIDFIGVGDMLRGVDIPDLTRAIWWPQMRTYLTCQRSSTGDIVFYCLTRHQDVKALGWSFWTFAGITSVESMFIAGEDLVIQSGRRLYKIASQDTLFRDDNDPADAPYLSRARWIYCDMGSPAKNKRLVRCEIVQDGTSSLSVYTNPFVLTDKTPGPPIVKGQTMGRKRVAIACMGPGIALEISSRDEEGHNLDSVGFDYKLLNR